MQNPWTLALALVACGLDGHQELRLAGPDEVRMERLGAMDPPAVVLPDGGEPEGLHWAAEPGEVARIDGERIVAVAPGEATVTGTWQGHTVHFTLVVDPVVQLRFVEPPMEIDVGERSSLRVEARLGEEFVPARKVVLSSSAPEVVRVDATEVVGVAPGIAYITADSGRSQAMLELAVVEP